MRVFLDTNVFLDMLISRENPDDNKNACILQALSSDKNFTFCVTPLTVATSYYIMRKDPAAMAKIENVLRTLTVIPVGEDQVRFSLAFDIFPDKEDSMLISAALSGDCEVILTRNAPHFVNAPLPVYSPKEFLDRVKRK